VPLIHWLQFSLSEPHLICSDPHRVSFIIFSYPWPSPSATCSALAVFLGSNIICIVLTLTECFSRSFQPSTLTKCHLFSADCVSLGSDIIYFVLTFV
jgi:hypothetical protein